MGQAEGLRPDDPVERLRSVRIPQNAPRPVPEDVLRAALARASRADVRASNPRLMILLAAYAGLRAAEIAQVRREDLDDDLLRVDGKGGKIRVVPVSGELLEL